MEGKHEWNERKKSPSLRRLCRSADSSASPEGIAEDHGDRFQLGLLAAAVIHRARIHRSSKAESSGLYFPTVAVCSACPPEVVAMGGAQG